MEPVTLRVLRHAVWELWQPWRSAMEMNQQKGEASATPPFSLMCSAGGGGCPGGRQGSRSRVPRPSCAGDLLLPAICPARLRTVCHSHGYFHNTVPPTKKNSTLHSHNPSIEGITWCHRKETIWCHKKRTTRFIDNWIGPCLHHTPSNLGEVTVSKL